MGKALQFMLDYCACTGNCSDCDLKTACYNLSKLSDEFVSIGGEDGARNYVCEVTLNEE